ncbi:MAG: hypothetical protein Q9227_003218 [Pyrenula ochraceoflavens]
MFSPSRTDLEPPEKLKEKSRSDNFALMTSCCSANLSGSKSCIHQRLGHAILRGIDRGRSLSGLLISDDEANTCDSMDNCLLHVAARWGAPLNKILEILDKTSNVCTVNHDKETFLHVWDPCAEFDFVEPFSELINRLIVKGFNFHLVDKFGIPFVNRLILRSYFPLKALLVLFENVNWEIIRSWACHVPLRGGPLVWYIQERVRRDECDSFNLALHTQFVMSSVLTEMVDTEIHGELWDVICPTAKCAQGSALQGMISTLNKMDEWTVTKIDWFRNEGVFVRTTSDFGDALRCVLQAGMALNSPEPYTGQTPLMTLLVEFGCSEQQDDKLLADCISALLVAGASLRVRDNLGNTPAHYAAALGLTSALVQFIHQHADLKKENDFGLTPQDLAMYSLRWEKASDNPRGVQMTARLLEATTILSPG